MCEHDMKPYIVVESHHEDEHASKNKSPHFIWWVVLAVIICCFMAYTIKSYYDLGGAVGTTYVQPRSMALNYKGHDLLRRKRRNTPNEKTTRELNKRRTRHIPPKIFQYYLMLLDHIKDGNSFKVNSTETEKKFIESVEKYLNETKEDNFDPTQLTRVTRENRHTQKSKHHPQNTKHGKVKHDTENAHGHTSKHRNHAETNNPKTSPLTYLQTLSLLEKEIYGRTFPHKTKKKKASPIATSDIFEDAYPTTPVNLVTKTQGIYKKTSLSKSAYEHRKKENRLKKSEPTQTNTVLTSTKAIFPMWNETLTHSFNTSMNVRNTSLYTTPANNVTQIRMNMNATKTLDETKDSKMKKHSNANELLKNTTHIPQINNTTDMPLSESATVGRISHNWTDTSVMINSTVKSHKDNTKKALHEGNMTSLHNGSITAIPPKNNTTDIPRKVNTTDIPPKENSNKTEMSSMTNSTDSKHSINQTLEGNFNASTLIGTIKSISVNSTQSNSTNHTLAHKIKEPIHVEVLIIPDINNTTTGNLVPNATSTPHNISHSMTYKNDISPRITSDNAKSFNNATEGQSLKLNITGKAHNTTKNPVNIKIHVRPETQNNTSVKPAVNMTSRNNNTQLLRTPRPTHSSTVNTSANTDFYNSTQDHNATMKHQVTNHTKIHNITKNPVHIKVFVTPESFETESSTNRTAATQDVGTLLHNVSFATELPRRVNTTLASSEPSSFNETIKGVNVTELYRRNTTQTSNMTELLVSLYDAASKYHGINSTHVSRLSNNTKNLNATDEPRIQNTTEPLSSQRNKTLEASKNSTKPTLSNNITLSKNTIQVPRPIVLNANSSLLPRKENTTELPLYVNTSSPTDQNSTSSLRQNVMSSKLNTTVSHNSTRPHKVHKTDVISTKLIVMKDASNETEISNSTYTLEKLKNSISARNISTTPRLNVTQREHIDNVSMTSEIQKQNITRASIKNTTEEIKDLIDSILTSDVVKNESTSTDESPDQSSFGDVGTLNNKTQNSSIFGDVGAANEQIQKNMSNYFGDVGTVNNKSLENEINKFGDVGSLNNNTESNHTQKEKDALRTGSSPSTIANNDLLLDLLTETLGIHKNQVKPSPTAKQHTESKNILKNTKEKSQISTQKKHTHTPTNPHPTALTGISSNAFVPLNSTLWQWTTDGLDVTEHEETRPGTKRLTPTTHITFKTSRSSTHKTQTSRSPVDTLQTSRSIANNTQTHSGGTTTNGTIPSSTANTVATEVAKSSITTSKVHNVYSLPSDLADFFDTVTTEPVSTNDTTLEASPNTTTDKSPRTEITQPIRTPSKTTNTKGTVRTTIDPTDLHTSTKTKNATRLPSSKQHTTTQKPKVKRETEDIPYTESFQKTTLKNTSTKVINNVFSKTTTNTKSHVTATPKMQQSTKTKMTHKEILTTFPEIIMTKTTKHKNKRKSWRDFMDKIPFNQTNSSTLQNTLIRILTDNNKQEETTDVGVGLIKYLKKLLNNNLDKEEYEKHEQLQAAVNVPEYSLDWHCRKEATRWSTAYIIGMSRFLQSHNVKCGQHEFLQEFQLKDNKEQLFPLFRYEYICCKMSLKKKPD